MGGSPVLPSGHQEPDSFLAELGCRASRPASRSPAPPCQVGPKMAFISAAPRLPPWAQACRTPSPLSAAPWLGERSPSEPEPHHTLWLPTEHLVPSLVTHVSWPDLAHLEALGALWPEWPEGPGNASWASLTFFSFFLVSCPAPSLRGHRLARWDLAMGCVSHSVSPGGRGKRGLGCVLPPH